MSSLYKRRMAFIGDFHVGSKYAVWPVEYKNDTGAVIRAAPGQAKMAGYVSEIGKIMDRENVDTLVMLADMIEGKNPKGQGQGLIMGEIEDQIAASIQLVKPLAYGRDVIATSGSDYHESRDINVAATMAKALGGTYVGRVRTLKIEGTNRYMNIGHGESGAVFYVATVMERGGVSQFEAVAKKKAHGADLIVRAHMHVYRHLDVPGLHYVQIPCMKAWEPSKIFSKDYFKQQPDLGFVIINIDQEDRITVWHYLFPSVPIADPLMSI